jgi:hypothetical protein
MASQVLVEQLALFQQQRVDDLQLAYKLAADAYATRTLPAFDEIPSHVLLTVAATLMLAQLLLLMLTRSGRKLVIETLDTMAATVLIILLVGIVLGLPVGEHTAGPPLLCSFA